MTLQDMIKQLDELSLSEIDLLKNYLSSVQPSQTTPTLQIGTMDIDALLETIDVMREGMSDAEFEDMLDNWECIKHKGSLG
ncbi:MAG: hypothetical protein SFZ02_13050 [bacterium]|nr:hypothetical protein [bacterium]